MAQQNARVGGHRVRLAVVVGLAGLILSACTSTGSAAPKPVVARHRPVGPPNLFAYVSLVGTGSTAGIGDQVDPIDLTTRSVAPSGPITVGTFPAALALSPSAKTAYVADYASDQLTPIDLATGLAGRPIEAGSGPAGVAVAPDGKTAYVTDAGSSPLGDTLTPIDLATGKAGHPIHVGAGPEGVAITPDGSTAYVADAGAVVSGQSGPIGHDVTAVDLATGSTTTIPVGNAPEAIAASPSGFTVYVGNANSDSITPIDAPTNTPGTPIPVGGTPQGIAFSPDGQTAWVTVASATLPTGGALVPIDVATGVAGTPIPVGKGPSGLAVTANGATAWVVDAGANRLVPVDLTTRTAGAPLAVAGGPYALVLVSRVPAPVTSHKRSSLRRGAQGDQRARPKR